MIKARKSFFHIQFLNFYFRVILRLQFRKLIIKQQLPSITSKPVLMIGNHFSWWDGILINELNRKYFSKDFYVLMLEEQLEKNKILSRVGAFSINRNSKSMVETFNYARQLLEQKDTLLLFYPQGEIQSMHIPYFNFKKGVHKLLTEKIDLIFYVCLPDYMSNSKPDLNFFFRSIPFSHQITHDQLEKEYNIFYQDCKNTLNTNK